MGAGDGCVVAGGAIGASYLVAVAVGGWCGNSNRLAANGAGLVGVIPAGILQCGGGHAFEVLTAPSRIIQIGEGGVDVRFGIIGFELAFEQVDVFLTFGVAVFGLHATICQRHEEAQNTENYNNHQQFDNGKTASLVPTCFHTTLIITASVARSSSVWGDSVQDFGHGGLAAECLY